MTDVSSWERKFIVDFITTDKQERYLAFLKGRKHRRRILERLNHSLDYDPARATRLDTSLKYHGPLVAFLRSRGVDETTCHLMADGNPSDGLALRLDRAVEQLLDNQWGALIVCPPRPIAVYKPEDIGDLILLS